MLNTLLCINNMHLAEMPTGLFYSDIKIHISAKLVFVLSQHQHGAAPATGQGHSCAASAPQSSCMPVEECGRCWCGHEVPGSTAIGSWLHQLSLGKCGKHLGFANIGHV